MAVSKKPIFLILFFSLNLICDDIKPSYTYIYPVAQGTYGGVPVIYLIHQPASDTLRLCMWDPLTKEVRSMLPSLCLPAGFKMLPSQTGFSFIDQGLIKVQNFLKRSPKTVELSDPIYNIMTLEWLSDTTCYLSAKEHGRFGIFQISINGIVHHILKSSEADYRYPQKVEDHLFFIEEKKGKFSVQVVEYPIVKTDVEVAGTLDVIKEFDVQLVDGNRCNHTSLIDPTSIKLVCDVESQPIAFLRMESIHEGFFVTYPAKLSMDDTVLSCTYYRLCKDTHAQTWTTQSLFVFHVPLDLIRMGSSRRLYESILPLLPRHFGDKIWYVSQNDVTSSVPTLDVFWYDLLHNFSKQHTCAKEGEIFFAPFKYENQMFYGFSGVDVEKAVLEMPEMPQCLKCRKCRMFSFLLFFCVFLMLT